MLRRGKKGQITIFIILAIMIILLGILIYVFYPKIQTIIAPETKNPSDFIQSCIEEDFKKNVKELSLKGGSLNPEHYVVYDNENIEYLCYTGEYYKTCIIQQPMLKKHIESEIETSIRKEINQCFDDLKQSYEQKGYGVNLRQGDINVKLLPKRIVTSFDHSLTLTKDGSEKYDSMEVVLNNNLYELVSITNSILSWESGYGDSETTIYMNYYHDLKVEKKKQSEGTTIYILTDKTNGNKFQFASRSIAWPPGYGS